ncbi:MAG: hypothetical protein IKJ43_00985 [Bacilli bacterium]|nr:hypothetical protein [Bacilli bacterium]
MPTVMAKDTVRMYKYYKLDREYGDYALEGSMEYPYLDKDDYIYSDYEISDASPLFNDNLEIEKVTYYEYKRTADIDYLNILNQSSDLTIYKIEVRYNGELIDYNCPELEGGTFILKANKDITLKFDKEYDQMRMTVRIMSDAVNGFVHFTTGNDYSKQAVSKTYIDNDFTYYGYNGTYFAYSKWVNDIYPNRLGVSRIASYVRDIIKYKYRYKLYHIYRENRNYYDDYLLDGVGDYIYRDEDDYKDYVINSGEINEQTKEKEIFKVIDNIFNIGNNIINDIVIVEVPNTLDNVF